MATILSVLAGGQAAADGAPPVARGAITPVLALEENKGQFPPAAILVLDDGSRRVWITAGGPVIEVIADPREDSPQGTSLIRMELAGADWSEPPVATKPVPGRINYLRGPTAANWQTGVRRYRRVRYPGVYPGVSLDFHTERGRVEYDFVLAPRADPSRIRIRFPGAGETRITDSGALLLNSPAGPLPWDPPEAYQEEDGTRTHVRCEYVIEDSQVRFLLGDYDRSKPLVIDPVLQVASYIGGRGRDTVWDITTDSTGNPILVGETSSSNFPTTDDSLQPQIGRGRTDAWIAKLDPSGSQLIWATYLGGDGEEAGFGIGLDGEDNIYVTGVTNTLEFPAPESGLTVLGVRNLELPSDVFVSKLSAAGDTLLYSTILAGADLEEGHGIQVNSDNHAYVMGFTQSADFPSTEGAFQPDLNVIPPRTNVADVFVTRLNEDGTSAIFSTFLGGRSRETPRVLRLDSNERPIVAGTTSSREDFPTTQGGVQPLAASFQDGFLSKLNSLGNRLIFSTYLGGAEDDGINGVALDADDFIYVTGHTGSSDFPVTEGAFQTEFAGPFEPGEFEDGEGDAFITKLSQNAGEIIYSTLLGGEEPDSALAIELTSTNEAVVGGWTDRFFPITEDAFQPESKRARGILSREKEAFVSRLDADGAVLVDSSYLGGFGPDTVRALTVDRFDNIWLAGFTGAEDFPVTEGAIQPERGSTNDAFFAKIGDREPLVTVSAASFERVDLAPLMIGSSFGTDLSEMTAVAASVPLPTELAGLRIEIEDSTGRREAAGLVFVSSGQVNWLVPDWVAPGVALIFLTTADGRVLLEAVTVSTVSPGLFATESGAAAGFFLRVAGDQTRTEGLLFNPETREPISLDLGPTGTEVFLTLFGTGLRSFSGLSNVFVSVGGLPVPVLFLGAQGQFEGLDQLNIGPIPRDLIRGGLVEIIITVDDRVSNRVVVFIL